MQSSGNVHLILMTDRNNNAKINVRDELNMDPNR